MIGLLSIRIRVSWFGTEMIVLEAEKQLSDFNVYRDVSNSKGILPKLSEASRKMFSGLRRFYNRKTT